MGNGEKESGERISQSYKLSSSFNNLKFTYLKMIIITAIFTSIIFTLTFGSVLFLRPVGGEGVTFGMVVGFLGMLTVTPFTMFLAGFLMVWMMVIPNHKRTIVMIRKDCSINIKPEHLEIVTRYGYKDKPRKIQLSYTTIRGVFRPNDIDIEKLWGNHPAFRKKLRKIPVLAPGVLFPYYSDLESIIGIELRSPTMIRQSVIKNRELGEDTVKVSTVYIDIEPSQQDEFMKELRNRLQ